MWRGNVHTQPVVHSGLIVELQLYIIALSYRCAVRCWFFSSRLRWIAHAHVRQCVCIALKVDDIHIHYIFNVMWSHWHWPCDGFAILSRRCLIVSHTAISLCNWVCPWFVVNFSFLLFRASFSIAAFQSIHFEFCSHFLFRPKEVKVLAFLRTNNNNNNADESKLLITSKIERRSEICRSFYFDRLFLRCTRCESQQEKNVKICCTFSKQQNTKASIICLFLPLNTNYNATRKSRRKLRH